MGVATANSILMVSFARERLNEGLSSTQAALQAGYVRIRPVLMTALAMIIGMVPLSLGLGEGGEQNAPLGRAVIGGLIVATFATLLFRAVRVFAGASSATCRASMWGAVLVDSFGSSRNWNKGANKECLKTPVEPQEARRI